jgi:hypothetical protein
LLFGAALAAALPARAQSASPISLPAAAPAQVYRLGTAAWPFAWSTVVGDLNADGRPDYAIADRIGRADGRFAYAIEFSIAGIPSRSLTFSAADAALTVSLRDVDHDHDLDIVVSAAFSRTVVGVWLNDGAGAFHRAPASVAAPQSAGTPQIDPGGRSASDGAASVLPTTPGLATADERVSVDAPAVRVPTYARPAAVVLLTPRLPARAPPPA